MSTKKNIEIVNPDDSRVLFATTNYTVLPTGKFITWKKQVYTQEEIEKNRYRLLYALENTGELVSLSQNASIYHTFTKNDVGKYVKFYAYIEKFNSLQQGQIFFVEEKHTTNVRIREVKLTDESKNKEDIKAGEKIKFHVVYSCSADKVPSKTRENVKWMVKIDGEEERLVVNGSVIIGGEIEFIIPKDWGEKEVILMPYLYKHTSDVGVGINVTFRNVPENCGGTWVEPIEVNKYQVLDVFLNRDKSNRIFYLDGETGHVVTIGYSATPYSFYNDDDGVQAAMTGAIIDTQDNSGRKFLNEDIVGLETSKQLGQPGKTDPISFWYYVYNATGGEQYDFKVTNGTRERIYANEDTRGKYRGMPINVFPEMDKPVYCSARDIGNIAAGLVAGMSGLSWLEGRVGFDGLETWQKEKLAFEAKGTQYAQRFGHNFGYNVIWARRKLGKDPNSVKEEVKILKEGDLILFGR